MFRKLIKREWVIYLCCFLSSYCVASETITVYTKNTIPRKAFVLFYMASCPHCRRFDPVLRTYARQHRIPVLAYTLDGKSLPGFPHSVLPTQAEIKHFFPNDRPVVPTLFLMDFNQHKIIPVLQGEAKMYQLNLRMQQIQNRNNNDAY